MNNLFDFLSFFMNEIGQVFQMCTREKHTRLSDK